uniref:Uncharacterized protein n=1 Tax=viral metagenome TaxID=1070528 RepID=A0A6M3XST0_9ZZZZ
MNDVKWLQKKVAAQNHIIMGQERLLICYRIGTRKGVDGALDKIEKGKRMIAKLEQEATDVN